MVEALAVIGALVVLGLVTIGAATVVFGAAYAMSRFIDENDERRGQ